MKTFYRDVDKRSRKEMTAFLFGHYRYHTANSWNNSTSYAHNLKVHNLGLDHETVTKLYDLIQCEEFYDNINDLIREFGASNGWNWQAGFNGRSGGYLVLYQGERKPSGYKSYCPHCGQLNYKTVEESNNICGRCRKEGRRNLTTTHMVISTFPGRGTDYGENFEDWEMCRLRERVELVQSFDKLADAIVKEAVCLAEEYTVEQEEYTVKKTRPILVAKAV